MFLLLLLGVVSLIISGILSGTFISGDRIRANYSEPKEFSERSRIGSMFFLFGIPCLLVGIAINYFKFALIPNLVRCVYELYKIS